MSNNIGKYISGAVLLLFVSTALHAQNVFEFRNVRIDSTMIKLGKMTVDDYMNISIPSLEELYENSRNANRVKAIESEADMFYRDVKSAKRTPLSWLSLFATYSYGNMDMAAVTLMQTTYNVWSQNASSQSNNYFNVGASFRITLYDVINHRNNVKHAEAKLKELEYTTEAEIDKIKSEIITLYCDITQNIRKLGVLYEQLILAKTQYDYSESEFVSNRLAIKDLFTTKASMADTNSEFELTKRLINEALLRLEIISCTPIVANYELLDDGD